jgi:hypothetical protein
MTPEERERFREGYRRWHEMSREERWEFRKNFRGGFGSCGAGMPEDFAAPKGAPRDGG